MPKKEETKKPKTLISQSEFARLVGASRQLVSRLIKEGGSKRIAVVKKGEEILVDKEKSIKLWNDNKDVSKEIGHTFAKVISKAKNKKEDKYAKEQKEILKNIGTILDNKNINFKEAFENNLSIEELVRMKILADVQKKNIELEIMRGDLISKQKVESILPSLLISFSTQIKMLPSRNAQQIASRLKQKFDIKLSEDEIATVIRESIDKDVIEMINIIKRDIKYEQ